MNKNRDIMAVVLFSAVFTLGMPLSSYAGQMTDHNTGDNTELVVPPANAAMPDTKVANETTNNGTGAAKGCATGAAVGTILFPGVGTIAGCAIVAVVGWFW